MSHRRLPTSAAVADVDPDLEDPSEGAGALPPRALPLPHEVANLDAQVLAIPAHPEANTQLHGVVVGGGMADGGGGGGGGGGGLEEEEVGVVKARGEWDGEEEGEEGGRRVQVAPDADPTYCSRTGEEVKGIVPLPRAVIERGVGIGIGGDGGDGGVGSGRGGGEALGGTAWDGSAEGYGSLDAKKGNNKAFRDLREEHGVLGAGTRVGLALVKDNWGVLLFLALVALGLAMLGVFAFDRQNMGWDAWAAFAILFAVLALLITNAVPTALAMLLGLTAMMVLRIVEPEEAVEGFSNVGVLAVAVLFVVAEGIQRTSVLLPVFRLLLGRPRHLWEAQLRVMVPVGAISAFLNNTPVVAMLIPVIQSWSRRSSFSASKLLMPMNNAAILGGTLTLLGTSTNLVVNGLVQENNLLQDTAEGATAAGKGLPIFGVTPIGAVLFVAGVAYMAIFSRFLLRERGQTGVGAVIRNPREYTVALLVQERSPIVGDTVQDAGLRQLQGLYLVEVTRKDGTLIPAVAPDTKIEAGDTLLFAGVVETVTELYHIPGLVPATGQSQKMKIERHHRRLVELVLAAGSALVGRTAKESQFRSRFSAAIIAVHRQGEHVKEKIADIRLRAGDTLLVEGGREFASRFGKDSNFALVSEVSGSQPPRVDRLHMVLSAAIAAAMVAVATAQALPLLAAASAAAVLMMATGCLSIGNAARSVNVEVVVTIAASFGISKGMEKTGAAGELAGFIVRLFEPIGSIGLLFGIYCGTALLSSVITNNAAVSLMFPVIKSIIKQQPAVNVLACLYALMTGASSSFSTPIGYQTNLMVHGPGGYTFGDWVAFGVPLQVVLGVSGVLIINWLHPSG